MRKVIAAFNMTLDNTCDHTAGIPDEVQFFPMKKTVIILHNSDLEKS